MPVYELACPGPECEYTEDGYYVSDRELPLCPTCGAPLERMMSVFTPDVR